MSNNILEQKNHLSGVIERVTFHSDQTGFCVLKVQVRGRSELITIIGSSAAIAPGESIEATGMWVNDKKHGLQFKASMLQTIQPTSLLGMEKYLASGMIKGVGPFFAKKLIKAFGEAVFDIIESQPERLLELEGIGEKRQEQLIAAWDEQKSVRNIMMFLQAQGVGTARAVRIYKTYGEDAIARIKENPYRLASDIQGIGFKTADQIAQKLGIPKNALLRAEAGVKYVLHSLCEHGHCASTLDTLIAESSQLLEIEASILQDALAEQLKQKNLMLDTINNIQCVFPVSLYQAETGVAKHLWRLQSHPLPEKKQDLQKMLPWVEKITNITLSESQKQAISIVLQQKLSIITGGPGVGKTTIVNSLVKILQANTQSVMLCAPTGRAAKRLTETTNLQAKTIHRLLEFDTKRYAFRYHQDNPLTCDVLIIDESSMIDIVLQYHLLKAIPDHCIVIFVGDVDQLPSVGPGAVLSDMIQSGVITTVTLKDIFRQVAHSNIIVNAHRINKGQMPLQNSKESDFFTIYVDTAEEIHDQLVSLVTKRLPEHYQCDPINTIQVLTPMNRGGLGASALNITLQKQLNSQPATSITRFGMTFAVGDKVIQIVNNYDKEIFNGDIGFITQLQEEDSTLKVTFDQKTVSYDFNELDELTLAYAISIHKSQGSEFPIIVLPISTQHYPLLAKNLLYTGVTRGRRLVVLVAQKKAVGMAVNNRQSSNRLTKLSMRLRLLANSE